MASSVPRTSETETVSLVKFERHAHTFDTTRKGQRSLVGPRGGSLSQGSTAMVPIASLLPSDSPRVKGEHADHVRMLAELDGELEPIIVHRPTMRVIDGMHRLRAARLCGHDSIAVRFFDGPERDVFVLAIKLNSRHGLPLSELDRTAAATRLIKSHPHWSDRAIAAVVGLSAKTVASIRRRSSAENPQLNGRLGRDGKVRSLNTAHGRRRASQLMSERPDASLREIAREAGISLGTVQDVRKRLRNGKDPVPPNQLAAARANDEDRISPQVQHSSRNVAAMPVVGNWSDSLRQLQQDPSLRFSEVGRAVLRLLRANSISAATWARLIDCVPVHCSGAIARAARGCAQSWMHFAEQIEQREATWPPVKKNQLYDV